MQYRHGNFIKRIYIDKLTEHIADSKTLSATFITQVQQLDKTISKKFDNKYLIIFIGGFVLVYI